MSERKEPYNGLDLDAEIDEQLSRKPVTYRLYEQLPGHIITVTINGDEQGYNPRHFVSKPFYTQEGIELALHGYKLLHGIALSQAERASLRRLLI